MSAGGEIYLDHAASSPVDPRVAAAMADCLADPELQGNASATHASGRRAAVVIAIARSQVADLIGAAAEDLVFTASATESVNIALQGGARANAARGRRLLTSRVEHRAVLDTMRQLEREQFAVDYLQVTRSGRVEPATVAAALRPDTVLSSFQQANNETGVVNDIAAMATACRQAGSWLHVDAAQSAGKLALDVGQLGAACVSISAHKLGGPKGIAALWIAPALRQHFLPVLHGGGQEGGLRPGTLATHQITGFGVAAELARVQLQDDAARVAQLREQLWQALQPAAPLRRNAPDGELLPGILSVVFPGIEGESLLLALDGRVAAASGSACNAASLEPSYVLRALGLSDLAAQATLRLSLGRSTTAAEIEQAAQHIVASVRRLRAAAPAGATAVVC